MKLYIIVPKNIFISGLPSGREIFERISNETPYCGWSYKEAEEILRKLWTSSSKDFELYEVSFDKKAGTLVALHDGRNKESES